MAEKVETTAAPSADKRWRLVDNTMRRHGYQGNALIETLHTVQECFGYLDETAMRYVAQALGVPMSKVFGVATFYHLFNLKPQGKHTCVVCLGTACYIKGAGAIVEALEKEYSVQVGETTEDKKLSVLGARCVGSCGLAPAVVFDGEVAGKLTAESVSRRIKEIMSHDA
jgi:bidirectional [NiFe] hydrogenase diaphorase subunit